LTLDANYLIFHPQNDRLGKRSYFKYLRRLSYAKCLPLHIFDFDTNVIPNPKRLMNNSKHPDEDLEL